jgi:hypothetical protein
MSLSIVGTRDNMMYSLSGYLVCRFYMDNHKNSTGILHPFEASLLCIAGLEMSMLQVRNLKFCGYQPDLSYSVT